MIPAFREAVDGTSRLKKELVGMQICNDFSFAAQSFKAIGRLAVGWIAPVNKKVAASTRFIEESRTQRIFHACGMNALKDGPYDIVRRTD